MDSDSMQDKPVSIENMSSHEGEAESNNLDSLEVVASFGDTTHELEGVAEVLTKVELDLACSSEKLVNLDMLFMHVASRENDFEDFALEEEQKAEGPPVKALEFDLLYGIFESEIKELEDFLCVLQGEILSSQEALSSFGKLGDASKEMEERFQDREASLKQCFKQVSDMKVQAANFKRILLASSGDEKWKDDKELAGMESGDLSDSNAKVKMQTAEQQKNILRMLEKSLAREMDLEKKLTESRQNEEDLQLRMQRLLSCMEVEAEDMWERLFEAENRAEILLGISKELCEENQMARISKNRSSQCEGELRLKLQDLTEQLREKDSALEVSENSRADLVAEVSSLEQKVRAETAEAEKRAETAKAEKIVKTAEAEKRAETVEAECKLLRESNMELDKDMSLLKSNIADASEKVKQLERLLKDSEINRLQAVASAVANEEKQNMLECVIKDMENLIKDLKSKVLKAENQTDSAEEKCIILSESNAELIEETNFLRRRVQHLESSLHQADEAQKDTAKDIRVRTKFIADLVLELALERERLHKQISSLAEEKNIAIKYLQRMKDVSGSGHTKEPGNADYDSKNRAPGNGSGGEAITSNKDGDIPGDLSINEGKTGSNLDTVRNIDARQLKFKHVLVAVVAVLGIPALAAYLFQQ